MFVCKYYIIKMGSFMALFYSEVLVKCIYIYKFLFVFSGTTLINSDT